MRKIYWAIAFLWLPFHMGAQDGVAWHNQGMASTNGNSGEAMIHIGGDMKFSNRTGSTEKPEMSIKGSRIKLTGHLINDVDPGASGGTLFNPGTGGVFEFCGAIPQFIRSTATSVADLPSKLSNFINFPKLVINNNNHITLDARMAARTGDIDLAKGWLILDSKKAEAGVDGGIEVDTDQESVLAHLLVNGTVDYHESTWSATDTRDNGFIQVNLKIPADDNLIAAKSIVGFGSPFKEIYTDYFMFNTLLEFNKDAKLKAPIVDPKTVLKAGKGYVVGIDLRGDDPDNYVKQEDYPGIQFGQRATDGYLFNRFAYGVSSPDNQLFGSNVAGNAYTMEQINTTDVAFPLIEGYNYLSNPYTCPLSIDKLLDSGMAGDWNVEVGDENASTADVYNAVWILNPNSSAEPAAGDIRKSVYSYNYLVAMKTGGTYVNGNADSYVNGTSEDDLTALAPLQMFVLWANQDASLTIPKSERVMGTTRFLRNAPQKKQRQDDFIIEFRDRQTRTFDRLSFVMRSQAELSAYSNVERMVSGSTDDKTVEKLPGDDYIQVHASQIYTKDKSGKPLSVQFLPLETTTRIQLYHIPSLEEQELYILGQRIQTKVHSKRMWLEDSKYNKTVEITPEMLYQTYSEPTDSRERFAILFSNEDLTGVDDEKEGHSAVYAYAKENDVFVQGFETSDFGSLVSLYDMNGRLLVQKTVDSPSMLLSEGCVSGVYLVKINDSHYRTLKVVVK